MRFNAGVILTDEEVRQLTETGCEIYPMNGLIQTQTRICEEITIVFLFLQSTRVDWLFVEILRRQKDSAQILQLVQLVRTGSRLHSLMRFHERKLSRARN